MALKASVVVRFDREDEGFLTVELDGRDDGHNNGETEFFVGDSPVFLVRKSPNVVFEPLSSSGSISTLPEENETVTDEYVQFADSRAEPLSKYPLNGNLLSIEQLSGIPSVFTFQNGSLVSSNRILGVVKVSYLTEVTPIQLNNVTEEIPVIVLVTGAIDE